MTTAVVGAQHTLGAQLAAKLQAAQLNYEDPLPAGCSGLVVIIGADPPPRSVLLTEASPQMWKEEAELVPLRAIRMLQHAHAALVDGGGAIVLVTPTIGLTGAANLVPYTTGIEAVRAAAKSAARQWTKHGITVNLVGVPIQLIAPGLSDHASHLTPPAVARADLVQSVVSTVKFMLDGQSEGVTGLTVTVDGGAAMVP